jgi:hypothetical protein
MTYEGSFCFAWESPPTSHCSIPHLNPLQHGVVHRNNTRIRRLNLRVEKPYPPMAMNYCHVGCPSSSHLVKNRRNTFRFSHIDPKVCISIPVHPTSSHLARIDPSTSPPVASTQKWAFHPTSSQGEGGWVFSFPPDGSDENRKLPTPLKLLTLPRLYLIKLTTHYA